MGRSCSVWARSAYQVLVGRPEGKTVVRLRRRLEENVKMDLRGTGWVFGLAEGRDQ
jgi:hypothetical protein